ncbi:unnamed protein product [Ostreobium quekettii]|uniref:Uncharacterized protein n=1 Tax=Ostreobium quekettii TaxID=121088 RepID=A0A8S1JD16_9CHLO|nr:unnamed protein product [Ostreobium quekettii]
MFIRAVLVDESISAIQGPTPNPPLSSPPVDASSQCGSSQAEGALARVATALSYLGSRAILALGGPLRPCWGGHGDQTLSSKDVDCPLAACPTLSSCPVCL